MRQCKVYVNGTEAGILQEESRRLYTFTYNEGYTGRPVCLSMPVRKEPYSSDHLFPYFFNMLSEGANRTMQARMLHIDENDDFGILLATAQSDTIGAVTVRELKIEN
jgi:serine/threonine-protein kinase HipA